MENYPWMWVPTLNFFGGLIAVVDGVAKGHHGETFVGLMLCSMCVVFGFLMHKCGVRWS